MNGVIGQLDGKSPLLFVFIVAKLICGLPGRCEVRKTFQGPFILQTLAAHLKDTAPIDGAQYYRMINEGEPVGALILALTAVRYKYSCYCKMLLLDVLPTRSSAL